MHINQAKGDLRAVESRLEELRIEYKTASPAKREWIYSGAKLLKIRQKKLKQKITELETTKLF